MTYQFPESLHPLRNWLRKKGFDDGAAKTERQAAFIAQQLLQTRFTFPPKGESCFMLLREIQNQMLARDQARTAEPKPEKPKKGKKQRKTTPVSNVADAQAETTGIPVSLVIYTDGACEPNPGAGGWSFVVYRDGKEIHHEFGGDLNMTNNIMEMTAALMALRWFASRGIVEPVRIYSDSQYTVKGCNEWRLGWKRKGWSRGPGKPLANVDLWKALDEALALVPIKLDWVKGHIGVAGNERADELAEIGRQSVLVLQEPSIIEQQLKYAV